MAEAETKGTEGNPKTTVKLEPGERVSLCRCLPQRNSPIVMAGIGSTRAKARLSSRLPRSSRHHPLVAAGDEGGIGWWGTHWPHYPISFSGGRPFSPPDVSQVAVAVCVVGSSTVAWPVDRKTVWHGKRHERTADCKPNGLPPPNRVYWRQTRAMDSEQKSKSLGVTGNIEHSRNH